MIDGTSLGASVAFVLALLTVCYVCTLVLFSTWRRITR